MGNTENTATAETPSSTSQRRRFCVIENTGISGFQVGITKNEKPRAVICEAGAADKVNPSPFVHLSGVTFRPKAKGSALAHSLSVLAPPRPVARD